MMLSDIISTLNVSKKIAITFHTSPDGDSLGSSLALMLALEKVNKNVYILCKDEVPETYTFLPKCIRIVEARNNVDKDIDCVVVLDCGNVERICADLDIKSRKYTLINIDHHLSNNFYGDLNLVDTKAAAVGEIIYNLLHDMNIELDIDIASCLYTSIVSDTGGFKHSNTTAVTHDIAGKLVSEGINFSDIHRILFQNKSFERIKLYGKVIDKMYLLNDGRICIMKLTKDMLNEGDSKFSDTSDIISIGVDIDTVEVTVLLKEGEEEIKISLRSKSVVDVRKIAENFGGGGHIRAAGLMINKSLKEAENMIINAIEKELI